MDTIIGYVKAGGRDHPSQDEAQPKKKKRKTG